MSLTRYDLIQKRTHDVMEPRQNGIWVTADEALRAVSDARVAGQRMALDEMRGWIEEMPKYQGDEGYLTALMHLLSRVEHAWNLLDRDDWLAGMSDGGDRG